MIFQVMLVYDTTRTGVLDRQQLLLLHKTATTGVTLYRATQMCMHTYIHMWVVFVHVYVYECACIRGWLVMYACSCSMVVHMCL